MKLVINCRYGGFSLSRKAMHWCFAHGLDLFDGEEDRLDPKPRWNSGGREVPRNHPVLVECVETLKEEADGDCANLCVVEVDTDTPWYVDEYDGYESVKTYDGDRGVELV